ncbi:MAG: AMP-binding protein, partial [Candidatus Competibacterales bacterium]|nr:AMP-binding protein [Candidatus Competibacterales bacterium]
MRLFDPHARDYEVLYRTFHWDIPERYNIARAICDRHPRDRVALYYENARGEETRYTFGQLADWSSQLANVLDGLGVQRGDRVALVLPQRVEVGVAHLAIYKLGAIALPLSVLFGPEALAYRLEDSGARAVITDRAHYPMLEQLQKSHPELGTLICCDPEPGALDFWELLGAASVDFDCTDTRADDPAILIYTSGTTGAPKGALDAHRCLLGNLTGFELSHNFLPQPDDLFWTPADWAWTGGLLDALLPAWHYGLPLLAFESERFDPERACTLLAKYRVRNAFIPPTALKRLVPLGNLSEHYGVDLRTLMSAGETVGEALVAWGQESLGLTINEMWGQTECNYLVGNCSAILPVRPGAMGRPYPGHVVDVIDAEGHVLGPGEQGELAVRRGDPVMCLGYWNRPEALEARCTGDWFRTGDVGVRDEDGYLWFVGRNDDVINSAGYRIGPGEIEDCLLRHPAVAQAAVIGVPDPERGE